MIDVNLLPWRDTQRKQDKKSFLLSLVICLAITFLILAVIHFTLGSKVKYQDRRNRILQTEINQLTNQISKLSKIKEKEKILALQIQILHAMQKDQYLSIKLMNEINQITPKGIFLQAVRKANNQFSIQGQATSNILVSQLMKSLKESRYILSPLLHEVATEKTKHGVMIKFLITAELKTAMPKIVNIPKKSPKK